MTTPPKSDKGLPILYSFRRCPYAMRARLALAETERQLELREVVLRNKPQAMLDASPKGTVPVLIVQGEVFDESLEIMDWALPQDHPWRDADTAQTREIVAGNDGPFKRALDRYKYPNRYDDIDPDAERQKGLAFIEHYEERLRHTPWLFGPSPTLADIAILPFVRQFANTDRAWFDALPLPGVHAWLGHFLESPRFAAIMEKYAPWDGTNAVLFPPSAPS